VIDYFIEAEFDLFISHLLNAKKIVVFLNNYAVIR